FDWAGVHIVSLDTFSQAGIAQKQVAWLEEDLAAHADAAWTIVMLHEPPFSSNAAHGSSERARDAFADVLARHGVDLILAAHDHAYERTHPIDGVVYVVSGGGGQSLYTQWEPKPAWSAARGAEYHVTLLEVYPDRIEGRVVPTMGGTLADAFTLKAQRAGGAAAAVATNETPMPLAPFLALVAVFALIRRR
ncbi:MAG TPA: metallophosphoesterase, partial [Candidatus Thermoplasmatota archaeon]|nr:metallophosphoesterase [Candidatus Thermoplasmatota archaeon]